MDCGKLRRITRCTLAFGVLVLAVGASTASAAKLDTGFLDPSALSRNDEFEIADPNVTMEGVERAGGSMIRLYLYWRGASPTRPTNIENPNDPAYHWDSDLQADITEARSRNMDVMLTIRSAPDWAQRGGHDSRGTHNPDPALLKKFAVAATAYYNDVHIWGVWNEPNYKSFLSPQYKDGKLVSPAMYRSLLNAAAFSIHANPLNKVVAGETAPFSHWNRKGKPTAPGPLLFLRKLLCIDSSGHSTCKTNVHADIFATHPYTSGNAFHHAVNANDVSFGDLPQWKSLINAASKARHITNRSGGHGAGLWITEFSWDSKPIDPRAVPKALHARWTSEALYRTWQLGIPVLLWGQLRDYRISTDPTFGQYQSGLFYCDDTPTIDDSCSTVMPPTQGSAKPALRAFRFPFVAYASNGHIRVWGRTPDSTPQQVTIEKKTSSGWQQWKSFTAGSGGIFSKTYASSMKKGQLRATVGLPSDDKSVGFSLVRPKDMRVNPFGCGGVTPC
ncbi:MAG TPA: cellulase family glycosylhydrolase [Gaiellaceae bacterium]|nr:cellulase family glycosylhydrolase [Gaiellaceae bacterium]